MSYNIYIYTYTRARTQHAIYVCMYVCIHTRAHIQHVICMYVYTRAHTQQHNTRSLEYASQKLRSNHLISNQLTAKTANKQKTFVLILLQNLSSIAMQNTFQNLFATPKPRPQWPATTAYFFYLKTRVTFLVAACCIGDRVEKFVPWRCLVTVYEEAPILNAYTIASSR